MARFKLKRLDHLIVKSFWAPYLASFFVAEFVLIMQFMWKYIDEILGKGFPILRLFELIFYYAITIIPTAIPLTILISSIMVYGNLSERYELTCIKSAGVSLLRIMRPAILIAVITAGFSFFTSNNLKPKAFYNFYSLFRSISNQKPSLSIEEGIFNNDFKDFIIRVGEKGKDDESIKDVLIYDHTDIDRRMINVIHAKNGRMYSNENGFIMELEDGYQYRDLKSAIGKNKKNNRPFMRTDFETFTKVFDMSQFDLDMSSVSVARRKHELLNITQLKEGIDSFQMVESNKIKNLENDFAGLIPGLKVKEESDDEEESIEKIDTINQNPSPSKQEFNPKRETFKNRLQYNIKKSKASRYTLPLIEEEKLDTVTAFINAVNPFQRKSAIDNAVRKSRSYYNNYSNTAVTITNLNRQKEMYNLKIHQQFSWAWMCIVFLFIGAPFGSIIRKGGYGYPLLIAIIFYVTFVISSISGDKLVRKGNISSELGAWFPVLILMPIAILVTYLALKDRKFNLVGMISKYLPSRESS